MRSGETQTSGKCYKHETPRIFIGGGRGAQNAKEIRERHRADTGRASDRSQQGSTLLRGPAGRAGGVVALYARTRVLKMTGKKGYYREEKTE